MAFLSIIAAFLCLTFPTRLTEGLQLRSQSYVVEQNLQLDVSSQEFIAVSIGAKEEQLSIHIGSYKTINSTKKADLCPNALDILPCICTVEDIIINFDCSAVTNEEELIHVFHQNFTGTNARKLTIKDNLFLTVLPEGMFGNTEFLEVEVTGSNIIIVETGALNSSYSRLVKLNFRNNKIISFPFDEIEMFNKLELLDVSMNSLTEFPRINSTTLNDLFLGLNFLQMIPDDSFKDLPALQRVRLNRCNIAEIPKGIFSTIPELREVDLTGNTLTQIANGTFVFRANRSSLFLGENNIDQLEPGVFTGITGDANLGSNLLEVFDEAVWRPTLESKAYVEIKENPLACKCDLAWLFRNETFLDQIYFGASCADGNLIHNLDPAYFDVC